MQQTEIKLRSADGLGLFVQEWSPDVDHRGVVCVMHGLGEHGGQYATVAESLAERGLALMAVDQRGHGRSDGKRGHTPSYGALLDDVDALLEGAAERHPRLPRFLYGHSLGGNVVLNHVLRREPRVAGVVATGPWLGLTHEPRWFKTLLASVVEPFWPTFTLSTKDDKKQHLDEVEAERKSELFHDLITIRLLMAARRAGKWAVKHANRLNVPALLMHGEDDQVTSPRATAEFGRRAGSICTAELLPGIGHNPHVELEEVIRRIADWVSLRLDALPHRGP